MNKKWKEKLINEIDSYLINLKNFKEKWSKENTEDFITNIKNKVNKELNQKDKLYESAIEFCKSTTKTAKINERAILSEISNKLKNEQIELNNILYYLNEEEKAKFRDWLYDYQQLILNGLNYDNYKKYKNLIHLLSMIGGFNFSWLRVSNEIPLDDSFAKYCQKQFAVLSQNKMKFLI